MPTIAIREREATETGFAATLSIDNQTQYDITVCDPFNGKQERELEFYFERWIQFPFDNQVIAKRAADSVKTYGESLFEQVFRRDPDAYSDYKQACRGGLTQLQIEIEGSSPDFQALHWEALKDPNQPRPFAVEGIFTRKRVQRGVTPIDLNPSPVINLLVVTARPDEESDVGYRTISRPLIDAIHQAQLRVNVEILRPGTFQALSDHLADKEGYYHIIHFDAHGGLMAHDILQMGVRQDRYVFQQRYGRKDMEPYDGLKAFLFLEGDRKGQADPVEAQELADLLTNKGIPICILNACQSGKQVRTPPSVGANGDASSPDHPDSDLPIQNPKSPIENSETSLGSRLMAAGIQMVVAMGYSVTVSAAALMMKTLYSQLFAQKGIPDAIRLGRRELYNQKNRRVYFNHEVELEDWLLPVVYANREVDLKLREFGLEEEEKYFEYLDSLEARYEFQNPTYGFVGRDLEILKVEKSLLHHNVLLLRGMGGTGKTTLLQYLWQWWLVTHFVEDAFYFGYDQKAHTVEQIIYEIGKRVYGRGEQAHFVAMNPRAKTTKLAKTLREKRYVLILDNLESVTGQELAIQNTLPEVEQQALRQFLMKLYGGKTFVVLGSRSGEEWLADTFTHEGKVNRYQLSGLDPESRTVLAEKILDAQVKDPKRIAALRIDDGFKRLMNLLAGYPLAMEVVLANLARQTPQEILDGLNAAGMKSIDAGGEDKTNNILKCVEYSHSNLSPDAQKLLVCLAPFNKIIFHNALSNYVQHLQNQTIFQNYDFYQLEQAIQEAINWGLLSFETHENLELIVIQPIFPYFLKTKLIETDVAISDAIKNAFRLHYQGLSGNYGSWMDSQESFEQKLGFSLCYLEYENLYSALQYALDSQEKDVLQIYNCLYLFLDKLDDKKTQMRLARYVCDKLRTEKIGEYTINYQILALLESLAKTCIKLREYSEAQEIYLFLLDFLQDYNKNLNFEGEQEEIQVVAIYHQLGIISQELNQPQEALNYHHKCLGLNLKANDLCGQAVTYHQLGVLYEKIQDYREAKTCLENAVRLKHELGQYISQASTYYHLGRVLQRLRNYEQAIACHKEALKIEIEYEDFEGQANSYRMLGIAAQALQDYKKAREYYQNSLDIGIQTNNSDIQLSSYHQLGNISYILQEYDQALLHYRQSLNIKIELGIRDSQALTHHQLCLVNQVLNKIEDARFHNLEALKIFVEFADQTNVSKAIFVSFLLYKSTQDESILTNIAQCLNITIEDVHQLFANLNLNE
ncbi:MAG: tetratricopeptide repeat protein [Elainellaceae cyanobacterium]